MATHRLPVSHEVCQLLRFTVLAVAGNRADDDSTDMDVDAKCQLANCSPPHIFSLQRRNRSTAEASGKSPGSAWQGLRERGTGRMMAVELSSTHLLKAIRRVKISSV